MGERGRRGGGGYTNVVQLGLEAVNVLLHCAGMVASFPSTLGLTAFGECGAAGVQQHRCSWGFTEWKELGQPCEVGWGCGRSVRVMSRVWFWGVGWWCVGLDPCSSQTEGVVCWQVL